MTGSVSRRLSIAAAVVMGVLSLSFFAAQSARADVIDDPTIEVAVTSTLPSPLPAGATTATETLTTFSDSYNTSAGTNYLAFYLNSSGQTWSDITVVGVEGGKHSSSHSFTNDPFNSSDFANCPGCSAAYSITDAASLSTANGGTPVTYADSGGVGVAPGQYLVIRYNNWVTSGPDSTFTITMSTPASEAAPETSSIALLAAGLLSLLGLGVFAKRRRAGLAVA